MPYRLSHVLDERGENFVVEYAEPVECLDGIKRKKVFYRCRRAGMTPGSDEHAAGHAAAEKNAWAHIEDVLNAGDNASRVDLRFGKGELSGTGRFRHHGDPHAGFTFQVHPRRPDFGVAGITMWRPGRDTLTAHEEFRHGSTFAQQNAAGTEIFRCPSREIDTGASAGTDWPTSFKDQPLQGKKMIEKFFRGLS